MKRFFKIVAFCFVFVLPLHAFEWDDYDQFAQYLGYERDYNKALHIAKEQNKDLFVIEVSDGCPFCHKLINKILTKKGVREYINKNYVKLLINRDQDKNFPAHLRRPFVPVTYIIDAQTQQIIDEIDGWMEEDNYLWHF